MRKKSDFHIFLKKNTNKSANFNRTLNRLTLDNFESLSSNLSTSFTKIQDPELFSEAVGLIFDKALSEPNFSSMYADLCLKIGEALKKMKRVNLNWFMYF